MVLKCICNYFTDFESGIRDTEQLLAI